MVMLMMLMMELAVQPSDTVTKVLMRVETCIGDDDDDDDDDDE